MLPRFLALFDLPEPISLRLAAACFAGVVAAVAYLLRFFPLSKIALAAAILSPLLWIFTWHRTPASFDLRLTSSQNSAISAHPLISRSHFPWLPLLRANIPKLSWIAFFMLPVEVFASSWLLAGYIFGMFCAMTRSSFVYGLPLSTRTLLLVRIIPGACLLLLSYLTMIRFHPHAFTPATISLRPAAIALTLTCLCAFLATFGFGLASWHRLWKLPRRLVVGLAFAVCVLPLPCWLLVTKTSSHADRGIIDVQLLLWLNAHLPVNPILLTLILVAALGLVYRLVEWQNSETEVSGLTEQFLHRARP